MEWVSLGARGPVVSRLCFGTLTMGPLQRAMTPAQGARLLAYAAAQGVNFLDTAEYYETYPHVGEAVRGKTDWVICTKTYAYDREGAARAVEKAQSAFGRSFIDIMLLHEQESDHTLRGHADALDYFAECKQQGIIGAIGLSTHHVAAVKAARRHPQVDVLFPILNVEGLGIADGTRGEMERAVREAWDEGIGILLMKALGGGHLIDDRRRALDYALNLPFADAIALGMQTEAEIDYNIALFEGREPSADASSQSASAPRTLHIAEYCEGCGRCVARCGQRALSLSEGRARWDTGRCVRCGYCAKVCPQFCIKVI